MGSYVTSKCPKCNYTFEALNPSWISFGDPRIECPKCSQIVLFKNIREWQLRSSLDKIWIIFRHYTFHNLAYTLPILFLFFIVLVIVLQILGKSYNEFINKDYEITIWSLISLTTFLIIAIYRHISFIREIRDSNKRMENKEYSEQIKNLY